MSVERITDLADPRVAIYRNLKESQLAREQGLFITEGAFVAERLFRSRFATHSVLVTEARADEFAALVPAHTPVYVVPEPLLREIAGFGFHRGVLAAGVRRPELTLEEVLGPPAGWHGQVPSAELARAAGGNPDHGQVPRTEPARATPPAPMTLVICPALVDNGNLGSIARIAAAFGATALILGPSCCDELSRKAIRLSMGTVFRLPVVRSTDLEHDLERLRRQWQVQLAATVLDETAEPLSRAARPGPPDRLGLLLGGEGFGLEAHHIALCDRRITIPMKLGTDSLNVAVAAAVFLYHFTKEG